MSAFTRDKKLAHHMYVAEQKKAKSALHLKKQVYKMGARKTKDAMHTAKSRADKAVKYTEERASWGHVHPKR